MKGFLILLIAIIWVGCGNSATKKDNLQSLKIKEAETTQTKEIKQIFFKEDDQIPQKQVTYLVSKDNKELFSTEYDFNQDGFVDMLILYNKKGNIKKIFSNLDHDHDYDIIDLYKGGKLDQRHIKNHITGKVYIWRYYNQQGELIKKEVDNTLSGIKNLFLYYEKGKPVKQSVDLNDDGIIDKTEVITAKNSKE